MPTDHEIIEAMSTYGGSFASALAEAIYRADAENREKLKAALPELWAEYKELVEIRAARKGK